MSDKKLDFIIYLMPDSYFLIFCQIDPGILIFGILVHKYEYDPYKLIA